jgi:hypothetical protein
LNNEYQLYDIQALPTLVGGHVRWHIHFTCVVRALKLVIRNPLSSPPKKEGKKKRKKTRRDIGIQHPYKEIRNGNL